MQVIPYHSKYAAQVAELLNTFLPFEIETADTVEQSGGVRFICVNVDDEVIGYIAGHEIKKFADDFPYFQSELKEIESTAQKGVTYYSSHFVVNPTYRQQGLGGRLVLAYMQALSEIARAVVAVGWVQSDTGKWAASRQFEQHGFNQVTYIPRYFEAYQVYCPSCAGTCYCDADIWLKVF